jgi:hypothetical protein
MDKAINFTVSGNEFSLSAGEVARRLNGLEPEPIRELYVEVSGVKFPIKQAFAVATGMQRGGFTSHDAMRVFRKLSLRIGPDLLTLGERLYTAVKSLNEFDKAEVNGAVTSLIAATDRDQCITGIYRRVKANVESLISLRYAKDFQAIASITRSLFELAADIMLIDVIPDAIEKIAAFSEYEKLRAARKIVAFKNAHPAASIDSTVHALFIKNNEAKIDADTLRIWGTKSQVRHWSGLSLDRRAEKLGEPFHEIYEVKYPQLSWYTHAAGLTGFSLQAASYERLATTHHHLAIQLYKIVLEKVIAEYQLAKVDSKILARMKQAELMPMMDTDEDLEHLERALLG